MEKRKRLFLFDAMALIYKYYFVFLSRPLLTSKGENIGAAYGFTNFLYKILEEEKPDYIAVLFDNKEPTFRHKAYSEYKATRQKMPEDMLPQMEKIKEIVNYFNITLVEIPGFEADDLIGTLAKIGEKEEIESYMVTSDKDFLQLISEHIKMYKPGKFGNEVEIVGIKEAEERFNVPIENIVEVFALMGDTSDNVPGVPGIGEKTAIPLIQEFKTLENLYENLDKLKKAGIKQKLENNKELAFLSKKLVTIDTNVPLSVKIPDLALKTPDNQKLKEIFSKLEFKSLLKKVSTDSNSSPEMNIPAAEPEIQFENEELTDINTDKHKYQIISDEKHLKELVKQVEKAGYLSFDLETTSTNVMYAEIVGISISFKERESFYIPVFYENADKVIEQREMKLDFGAAPAVSGLPVSIVLKALKGIMEDESIKKIGQNLKYDMTITMRHGIDVKGFEFDTMIASYLIDPDSQHNLDALARKYLNYKMVPITDLIGSGKNQKSMRDVPLDIIANYSAEDADMTLRLKNILEKDLDKYSMTKLCKDVEFPLISVLCKIELIGVLIDVPLLKNISKRLEKSLKRIEQEIYDHVGYKFNINSTKQLQEILFEKLGLTSIKKTKTGHSTDMSVLEELRNQHPVAKNLLEYRQQTKLKSTYIDALPALINPNTGRIHTSFNQAVVTTGRLSSSEPNLQNIPIRTDVGKEIRKAFIAEKNKKIISADYSQIELRVMAHISKDEGLLNAFLNNEDIHTSTAANVFGVNPKEVTSDMRRKAKEVNFGIMYGIGAFGLKTRLEISQNEAKDIIDTYFRKYPGIKRYIDDTIKFAKEKGYVETILGRKRYFKNILSKNQTIRQFEERAAINMPIQGTAAEMIKLAMIKIQNIIESEKLESKMILQVHDELLFEVPDGELNKMKKIIEENMRNALKLEVPILVDVGQGTNWFDAHS
jgi:DNA polymerase I